MYYSRWQITECCQLPLSSLPLHDGCPRTALTKPLESYSTFQLRSKNNEQLGSSNRVQTTQVHCRIVFTWIFLQCVLFLFASTAAAAAANKGITRSWREITAASRNLYVGFTKQIPLHTTTAAAPACYVIFMTGNKRTRGSSARKHSNKRIAPSNRPRHPCWTPPMSKTA